MICRLPLFFILLISTYVQAKTWTHLNHRIKGDPCFAAIDFIKNNAEQFGAEKAQLDVSRIIPLKQGTVVKLVQKHKDKQILGAGLSVLILKEKIIAVSGKIHTIKSDNANNTICKKSAIKAAKTAINNIQIRKTELVFRVVESKANPVWVMDIATYNPFGLWRIFMDAHTGKILYGISKIVSAKANVYPTNPTVSSLATVDLKGLGQPDALMGEYADVSSCNIVDQLLNCVRYAQPDQTGDYLFQPDEPSNVDPFSEVQAYFHVDTFHRWLKNNFGFMRKGSTQQIKVFVNLYGENSQGEERGIGNAFFGDLDGDNIGDLAFGQGKRDYAYDADVIFHEFTHSVVEETSDLEADLDELGINMIPMALNEGFADLMSATFTGDPVVGDYAGGSGGIRNLIGSIPCQENLSGESHSDGLIWGRANWSIRTTVGDEDLYNDILYTTMVSLDSHASFPEATALLLQIAQNIDPKVAQIAQAEFKSKGIDECSRIVPLKSYDIRMGYIMGTSSLIYLSAVPGPMQYKIIVPNNAIRLRINVSHTGHHGPQNNTRIGLYIRKDSPVVFNTSKSTYDFVMSNEESFFIMEPNDPKAPLIPGAEYYVLPLNVGEYDTLYEITSIIYDDEQKLVDASVPLDAGVNLMDGSLQGDISGSSEENTAGCNCRVAQAPSLLTLSFVIGIFLLLRKKDRG